MKKPLWVLLGVCLLLTSACRHADSSRERARITAESVEVKKTRATLAVVVAQIHRGDEVEILGRESHWLRIRTAAGQQGWIEESTALNQAIVDAESSLVRQSQHEVMQAAGELSSTSNLHIEPGRETPVYRRIPKGERVEIFARTRTDRSVSAGTTTPRSSESSESPANPPSKDSWLKIRTAKGEVGWIYSPSVNFNVPDEIAEYSESKKIVAWQVLNQVEGENGKKFNQYVVADVTPGRSPDYDFDRIRVLTWNRKRQRYETAFRESKIYGCYPIRIFTLENKPAFEIVKWSTPDQPGSKVNERYVMNGVMVRRVQAEKSTDRIKHQPSPRRLNHKGTKEQG